MKYFRNLSVIEKSTFRLHLIYSILEGFIIGALALNEFVLVKSLKGSDYQIGILFQFTVALMTFSVVFNQLIRRANNKKLTIQIIGVLTRLPLILMIFIPSDLEFLRGSIFYQCFFLGAFLIYYFAEPIVNPLVNLYLKNNYSHENFGKLYSYASSANKIVMLFTTFLFGLWLDHDHFAFRYLYPVLGFTGMLMIYILTKIDYKEPEINSNHESLKVSILNSFKNMILILKRNKPFRDFEIGFMLYGFSWLITMACITLYFENSLHLNYTSIAFYKNVYNILAIMILPFFGRLLGKIDPRKFAVYTYSSILIFFIFLTLSSIFRANTVIFGVQIYYMLLVAYLFYSIFAATMALLWYIGSAYFCKTEETGQYQAVHVTLTGMRGATAPILGVWFLQIFNFTGVFIIAMIFIALSILMMIWSEKKHKSIDLMELNHHQKQKRA